MNIENTNGNNQVMVDIREMGSDAARVRAEDLIFQGKKKPSDKYERAAQKSFMDLVMELMKDGGQLVKL